MLEITNGKKSLVPVLDFPGFVVIIHTVCFLGEISAFLQVASQSQQIKFYCYRQVMVMLLLGAWGA